MMSFCGFFPADDPQYTLLVQTIYEKEQDFREEKTPLGGGSSSALVFKEIAEKIMAKKLRAEIEIPEENEKPSLPAVKSGNLNDAGIVLSALGMTTGTEKIDSEWGKVSRNGKEGYKFSAKEPKTEIIPNVTGMGAKDAVYLLQNCGLEIKLQGYGTVYEQSLKAGNHAKEGDIITLMLRP